MNAPAPRDLLLLHASEARAVAAVAHAGRLAVEAMEPRAPQARTLLGTVQVLLERLGVGLADLEGLVVTTGPGSFTGIRVGLATAQGLSAARGWSPLACDSLKPHAVSLPAGSPAVAVLQDARRDELYGALYDVRERLPRELVAPFCASPAAAAHRLLGALPAGAALSLVGTGAERLRPELEGALALQVHATPAPEALARALVALARGGACRRTAPEALEPLYLRRPDAEAAGRSDHV